MNHRTTSISLFLTLIAWLPVHDAHGEVGATIRLDDVPGNLELPAREGTNRLLTAVITGQPASWVWMSATGRTSDRLELTQIGDQAYQVNLYSDAVYQLLGHHQPRGEFQVKARLTDGSIVSSVAVAFSVQVPPERLDFPWDKASVTIVQRSARPVPGSGDRLHLWIGDITAGRVSIWVGGPHGAWVMDRVFLREGEATELALAEATYVIHVDKMVNYLIGDDFVVLTIMPEAIWSRDKIQFLLDEIAASDLTFIRNGVEIEGEIFAQFLQAKLGGVRSQVQTAEEFINEVGSKSSTTGTPYRVQLSDGSQVDLYDWLHAVLERGKASAAESVDPNVQDARAGTTQPSSAP